MEQRAERKASRFIGVRLNSRDQENVALIIRAGLAESISDAIRCGLDAAAAKARRIIRSSK